MHTVYLEMGGLVPVWAVSHTGHDATENKTALPPIKDHESVYSITAQIKHKIRFIEEHVPADCEVTLVGHSVGCYVIMGILNHFESTSRHFRAYMLFPMMELMYETPNGWLTYIMVAQYGYGQYVQVIFSDFPCSAHISRRSSLVYLAFSLLCCQSPL